ncbi:uncharacterized protein LOC143599871 [Bidens hawaiensis]|uniref:uncharacterized protein LOC143599871 n=1 Tax=Bidens hawaiensis TaxID=980011 RepID=UPI0040494BAD
MGKTKRDEKQYWLLKTEPSEWSWEDQASNGGISKWDGVKNHQALNHLKSARLHDLCFFYHSGTNREWYEDDAGAGAVDVKAVGEMRRVVDLKGELGGSCKGFGLFRQPTLSVVPVPEDVWEKICEMGGGYEGDGVCVGNEEEDDEHV